MNPAPFIYTAFGISAFVLIGYTLLQVRLQRENRRLLTLLAKGTSHGT